MDAQQEKKQHLRRVASVSSKHTSPIFINDTQGHIVFANAAFTKVLGWTEEELVGSSAEAFLLPTAQSVARQEFDAMIHCVEQSSHEIVLKDKQGNRAWYKALSAPIYSSTGEALYRTTTLKTTTAESLHEALQSCTLPMMAQERPLEEILTQLCLQTQRFVSDALVSIFGFDDAGVMHCLAAPHLPLAYKDTIRKAGLTLSALQPPHSQGQGAQGTPALISAPIDALCTRIFASVDGHYVHWSTPICTAEGEILGILMLHICDQQIPASSAFHWNLIQACTHLSAMALSRASSQKQMHQLAFQDNLTGLPNRSSLLIKSKQILQQSLRTQTPVASILIEVHPGEGTNDLKWKAHHATVLLHLAGLLKDETRSNDVLAHLPGDEFLLLMPQTNESQANSLIQRLLPILNAPIAVDNGLIQVKVDMASAVAPQHGATADELYQHTHIAMCKGKPAYEHAVCMECPAFGNSQCQTTQLEAGLLASIQQKQLHLYYQPQINLLTGKLYGVEALARWFHPTLGTIPPAHFIPLAEACGFITQIGLWAIKEACLQMAKWQRAGLNIPNVSVNLSSACFQNKDLPVYLADLLSMCQLSASCLTLELTENLLLQMTPSTMEVMHKIQAQGIKLSIDDFGTGYSGLNYLRRIAFSEVKLDRSFTADLGADGATQVLSKAVLNIGENLGISVVAEGIETPQQNQLLIEQGYKIGQGYLFAKPVPAHEIAQRLQPNGLWI